eukprot:176717-Pleurochrysis_carterae.AAC.1
MRDSGRRSGFRFKAVEKPRLVVLPKGVSVEQRVRDEAEEEPRRDECLLLKMGNRMREIARDAERVGGWRRGGGQVTARRLRRRRGGGACEGVGGGAELVEGDAGVRGEEELAVDAAAPRDELEGL